MDGWSKLSAVQCLQVVWEWEGSPLLAGGGRAVVDRGRQGRYRGEPWSSRYSLGTLHYRYSDGEAVVIESLRVAHLGSYTCRCQAPPLLYRSLDLTRAQNGGLGQAERSVVLRLAPPVVEGEQEKVGSSSEGT